MTASKPAPLAGLRVVECSVLGPAAVTSALADLGAEVIKVEPPSGDYVRGMTWPIVEGVSLLHLHVNRSKKGIVCKVRRRKNYRRKTGHRQPFTALEITSIQG